VAAARGRRSAEDLEAAPRATVTVTVSPSTTPPSSTGSPTIAPTGASPTSTSSSPTAGTPTGTPTLADFDPSEVEARNGGTTKLSVGQYGLEIDYRWGDSRRYGGSLSGEDADIVFHEAGMSGREGTQFAPVRAGAKRSFPTCQAEKSWVPSLGWNQLTKGTFVCLTTPTARRGLLRIDEAPDLDSDEPWVQVTGVTW
jgi:hypothetical protein